MLQGVNEEKAQLFTSRCVFACFEWRNNESLRLNRKSQKGVRSLTGLGPLHHPTLACYCSLISICSSSRPSSADSRKRRPRCLSGLALKWEQYRDTACSPLRKERHRLQLRPSHSGAIRTIKHDVVPLSNTYDGTTMIMKCTVLHYSQNASEYFLLEQHHKNFF